MDRTETRSRMLDTAVKLFQRDGYEATSWRGLVKESGTPWGSVHHHFPGGKEELGVAAIELGSEAVLALIVESLRAGPSPGDGIRSWFAVSAQLLEASDYADGCPIATVALETASSSPALRAASMRAFDAWADAVTTELEATGVAHRRATELGTLVISGFEGALVLCRVGATTTPLRLMADLLASQIGLAG